MLVSDEETKELKKWIIKKLEDMYVDLIACSRRPSGQIFHSILTVSNRSDADSDVLGDYVLALISADSPEAELRTNAIENLEDFLKDSMLTRDVYTL